MLSHEESMTWTQTFIVIEYPYSDPSFSCYILFLLHSLFIIIRSWIKENQLICKLKRESQSIFMLLIKPVSYERVWVHCEVFLCTSLFFLLKLEECVSLYILAYNTQCKFLCTLCMHLRIIKWGGQDIGLDC